MGTQVVDLSQQVNKPSVIKPLLPQVNPEVQAQSPDTSIPPELAAALAPEVPIPSLEVPRQDPILAGKTPDGYGLHFGEQPGAAPDINLPEGENPLPSPPPGLIPPPQEIVGPQPMPQVSHQLPQLPLPPGPQNIHVHKTLSQRLQDFLPLIGAIGGGLEAVGGPVGQPARGAEMLQRTLEAGAQRQLEREKIAAEAPLVKAHAEYFSNFNPTKLDVQGLKNEGNQTVQGMKGQTAENIERMKDLSALQIAALKQGAPMTVSPRMAMLAGQPQLANTNVSGATLQNLTRILGARGIHIQDLADEGLWAVTKDGQRIEQLSINSPTISRAREYAKARAENTPFKPVFDENGNLTTISNAQALQEGIAPAVLPTTATRGRGEQASAIEIVGNGLIDQIKANAQELGPLMGRYQSLEDWIGSPDPEYKGLKAALESWIALHPAAHGFRGLNAVREFQKAFGSTFNTPESLIAGIQGSFGTMEGLQKTGKVSYSNRAPVKGENKNKGNRPPLSSFHGR